MNYTRGQKLDRAAYVSKLIQSKRITPDGADWLTLRLDPYHDFARPIAGYPDADAFDTIVSAYNYEYNVSKPAGAAANWDAHVFTLPFASSICSLGNITAGQFVQTADGHNMGLVNVAKDDAGGPLFPTAVPVASANFSMTRIDTFAGIEAGVSRVIGMGIEIIDTTAQLYKQGALTAYKMPTVRNISGNLGYLNTAGTLQTNLTVGLISAPPSTVAEAVLYRSSVQWETHEGCYMSVGQEGVVNDFATDTKGALAITTDGTFTPATPSLVTNVSATTALQAPPILTSAVAADGLKRVNVTQSGVFLSGLHNDATFKVRVRVYVERAPERGDTDLIPLCSPSAPYDAKALELYSMAVTMLPVAVPVSFNAKGDWWKWIVKVLGEVAPILGGILTPVIGPEAGAIGSAVGGVLQTVSKKNQPSQIKPKPRQANQMKALVERESKKKPFNPNIKY